jgi:cytochrome c oxidase cbb3-type subunit 2
MSSPTVSIGYRVLAPLVLAKDEKGLVHHKYEGSVINWLSEDQASQWVSGGLVQPIEVSAPAAVLNTTTAAEPSHDGAVGDDDRVRECIDALDALGVPSTAGAPIARGVLRDNGHKFGNDTIAAAVRNRRELSGTAEHARSAAQS